MNESMDEWTDNVDNMVIGADILIVTMFDCLKGQAVHVQRGVLRTALTDRTGFCRPAFICRPWQNGVTFELSSPFSTTTIDVW